MFFCFYIYSLILTSTPCCCIVISHMGLIKYNHHPLIHHQYNQKKSLIHFSLHSKLVITMKQACLTWVQFLTLWKIILFHTYSELCWNYRTSNQLVLIKSGKLNIFFLSFPNRVGTTSFKFEGVLHSCGKYFQSSPSSKGALTLAKHAVPKPGFSLNYGVFWLVCTECFSLWLEEVCLGLAHPFYHPFSIFCLYPSHNSCTAM